MSMLAKAALVTALVSLLTPASVMAQPLRHKAAVAAHKAAGVHRVARAARHHRLYVHAYRYGPYGPTSADPYPPSAADDPYNPYAPPGAAIRAMSRRNQYAPGVTNELAPDNIATATGGPSGGIPGFSGH